MRIAVVEDEEGIRKELKQLLQNALYDVAIIENFENVAEQILTMHPVPDLVLLDLNLPGESGFDICTKLRGDSEVPVIFLTSRTDSMDELTGILKGADDYITKPFHAPILLARIAVVLKRTTIRNAGNRADEKNSMEYKGVKLNLAGGYIEAAGGRMDLTKNELKIMHLLYQRSGEIVPRMDMIEYLWDNEVFIDDNTLSVNMTRLRNKLSKIGVTDFIETKRGMAFFYITGYRRGAAELIFIFWWFVIILWIVSGYVRRKRYFDQAERILENVDQRYLLGELLPPSPHLEDRLYREMICRSNKSVIERIRKIEEEQRDYREYIESWVHEVKAPITSIQLACENHKNEVTRQISRESLRIENDVDMVLYYARMENVYKDYMIAQTDLQETASEILKKNKYMLITGGISASVECPDRVYTDKKWILFILNQLVLNSVKYGRKNTDSHPYIHIYTEKFGHGVRLIVADNGTGIREEEIPWIFEKGFTGSNGRSGKKSTGMGLYLCRKLCAKLGIQIEAESVYGEGTTMILTFPISDYLSKM